MTDFDTTDVELHLAAHAATHDFDFVRALTERHDSFVARLAKDPHKAATFIVHAPELAEPGVVCAGCEWDDDGYRHMYPCPIARAAVPEVGDVYVARAADGALVGPFRTEEEAGAHGSIEAVRRPGLAS